MFPQVVLRHEGPADIAAIHALTAAAFRTAPHTAGTEQFIVDALRKAGALALSLVAEINGEIVGHVALSPVTFSSGAAGWFGLGPISVQPERQRQGLGTRLMREALALLRARGTAGCVLVGDPAFYARFGFHAAAGLVYPGVPAEYCLVLPFAGSVPAGEVMFHAAFRAVE